VDQGHRRRNAEVERILADALAVEDARMIGFNALAHKGGIPADVH
jgi:hypothetical protein